MSTTKKDSGLDTAAKTSTGTSRQRVDRGGKGVLIYSEVSITVKVDAITNNFIKITAGHERMSPTDSDHDLTRTFKKSEAFNEAIVDRQAKRLKRLIRSIEAAREE